MYGQQNLKKRIRYYVFPAQYMLCAVMCRGILHQLCVCHWIARICQLANFTSCIQPEGGCISAETRRCLLLTSQNITRLTTLKLSLEFLLG